MRGGTLVCPECGYEHKFATRLGMFDDEGYKKLQQMQKDLKNSITNGEYGKRLQALMRANSEEEIEISCEMILCQCKTCRKISEPNRKRIRIKGEANESTINIELKCDECNGILEERFPKMIRCPKCTPSYIFMELESIVC